MAFLNSFMIDLIINLQFLVIILLLALNILNLIGYNDVLVEIIANLNPFQVFSQQFLRK